MSLIYMFVMIWVRYLTGTAVDERLFQAFAISDLMLLLGYIMWSVIRMPKAWRL